MRKMLIGISLLLAASFASADMYKVYVRRIDQDIYRTAEGFFIKTMYCYQYAYGEEAILEWDGSFGRLIFVDAGDSCDVKSVFK